MVLPVRWAAAAERDLVRIADYLWPRSRQGAASVVSSILGSVERVAEFPETGEAALDLEPGGDLRRAVSGNYLIFYRVHPEAIRVLRIWDARRDPATLTLPGSPTAAG